MLKKAVFNGAMGLGLIGVTIVLFSFTRPGDMVQDFRLKNVDGRYVSLKDYKSARGFIIVFTCNHCPYAKKYPERLNELNKKYKPLGVPVIAISSADTLNYAEDTYAKMVVVAKTGRYSFPYLYDNEQTIARNFAAQKTPHAFVIWKQDGNWVIKYSGAIDDNGADAAKVLHHYVADAVDDLLKGQPVAVAETRSIGCGIRLRR